MNQKQSHTSNSVHFEGDAYAFLKEGTSFFLEATGSLACRRGIRRMFIVMNAF